MESRKRNSLIPGDILPAQRASMPRACRPAADRVVTGKGDNLAGQAAQ
jgi:hypothetical protein